MLEIRLDSDVIPPRAREALRAPTNPVHRDTPTDQEAMNVGLPVRLTLTTSGVLTDPGAISWTISAGDPIKDYDISAHDPANEDDPEGNVRGYLTACGVVPLDPDADLIGNADVQFYFREVGTCEVTAEAEVGGIPEMATIVFDVKRDPKAEIYYVTGREGAATPVEDRDNTMGEHYYWHAIAEDAPGFNEDNPGRFFHFHRGYIGKFNCWRGIFGYPCVKVYVPGPNHVPAGREVDHVGNAGDGNGIVREERHPNPGAIRPLPAEFSIEGDGSTALADFADENDLAEAVLPWHGRMHVVYLCSFGDFSPPETAPADPIFWRFHLLLTQLFALHQLLKLDGQSIPVLQAGPGGTRVFYPDPDVTIMPDCAGGIPSGLNPASGHLFPVGVTTVTGEARDVVLLDPDPEPDPDMQEAIVGRGTTTPISFDVEVIPQIPTPIPADIYLVLDDTASMNGSTPAGPGGETPTKIQALKDSMAVLTDVLRVHREGVGDNIGALAFKVPPGEPAGPCKDSWLQELVPFGPLDDRVQNDASSALDVDGAVARMVADGSATPLRMALRGPSDRLSVQPADRKRWIVLLTDGKQNTDECLIGSTREPEYNDPQVVNFRNEYLAARQINLLAVGFGGGNAINEPLLRTLAARSDDYFDFASDGPGSLIKWFDAAVSRVLDQAEIIDPHGVIGTGETVTEEVPLTRACRSVTFILSWAERDLKCPPRFLVESPGGEPIRITEEDHDPDRGITWVSGPQHKVVVVRFPLKGDLGAYHRGVWRARVDGPGRTDRPESTSYTLAAIADEPGRLRCGLPDEQIHTGAPIRFTAELTGPVRRADVTLEIVGCQHPIGSRLSALARHDGGLARDDRSESGAGLMERQMDLVNESIAAQGGHRSRVLRTVELAKVAGDESRQRKLGVTTYEGWSQPLKADGAYSVVFKAEGVTILGDRFRRECSMGLYAAPGIGKQVGEIHLHPVDDDGLVFDWRLRPSSGKFDAVELGPGHAADISLHVTRGSAEDVVDRGDGAYSVRLTRDNEDEPAEVRAYLAGKPLAAFRVPLAPGVRSVTPTSGPEEGGGRVRVHGEQLERGVEIHFGGRVARDVKFLSETLADVEVPPGKGGVAVSAASADGRKGSASASYRYISPKEADPCAEPTC